MIEITIDGTPVDRNVIAFLVQTDPHPGGHRYLLRLTGAVPRQLAPHLEPRTSGRFGRADAEDVFGAIEWLVARTESRPVAYFLNTIDAVHQVGDLLEISGVCSVAH